MQRKVNVLNIITIILDGGLERHVHYILSNKSSPVLNHKVVVLTGYNENQLTKKYERLGIEIVYYDFDNKLFNIKTIPKNLLLLFRLSLYIRKNKINVIHSHDFFPAFVSRFAAIVSFIFLFHRVKRIYITLHIVFFWLNKFHHIINRALGTVTTKIVCLSNAILQYSLKTDKLPFEKYQIIYTGIDTAKFIENAKERDRFVTEFGFRNDDIIIGNIGVLSIRKGQIYLLQALNTLKYKFPNLKVLIFGSEREHELEIKRELLKFIADNDLSNNVKIIQPREDINLVYNVFDIFVMPSITEGLSACAIEALFMKRICLFSDIEPFKELVRDSYNGFLFRNKDVNDLTGKLHYILSNINSMDMIKRNARASVDERFDIKTMVASYEKLYMS